MACRCCSSKDSFMSAAIAGPGCSSIIAPMTHSRPISTSRLVVSFVPRSALRAWLHNEYTRPHRMHATDRVASSVGRSVDHDFKACKNGWTGPDANWGQTHLRPKNHSHVMGVQIPNDRGNFGGFRARRKTLGLECPQTPISGACIDVYKPNAKKILNVHFSETTSLIPTKFCKFCVQRNRDGWRKMAVALHPTGRCHIKLAPWKIRRRAMRPCVKVLRPFVF